VGGGVRTIEDRSSLESNPRNFGCNAKRYVLAADAKLEPEARSDDEAGGGGGGVPRPALALNAPVILPCGRSMPAAPFR